jgi:hypothetical protein
VNEEGLSLKRKPIGAKMAAWAMDRGKDQKAAGVVGV